MAVAAALCASSLFAADADQLKGLPRGVQNIKYKDGVISTLVVVGKAAVPKALRTNPGRASQYGGEKARSEAQLEFVRFLSTKCQWGRTSEGETAVKEESASATDAQGNETSAASSSFTETEMTKEQKAQSAQACISGIQVLWEGMNDSGEYVWVGAWNAKAVASIKGMAKTMNEAHAEVDDMGQAAKAKKAAEDKKELEAIEGKSNGGESGDGTGADAQKLQKNGDPDILKGMKKPKSAVAKDADEFL
ncbi:MAG: hypothetical protein ACI4RD_00945 [Kiritimatiellia bacterium]